MKPVKYVKLTAICTLLSAFAINAQANTITCSDKYRTASLSSADICYAQTLGSTAKAADVKTITGSSWNMVGALTGNGTDNWFSVSGTGWGSSAASGNWSISDLFWDNFTSALITMHVGGGQKDAVDNFEWLITPESLTGTFGYTKSSGKGGGLSNIKLWGMGTVLKPDPVIVPPVIIPPPVVVSPPVFEPIPQLPVIEEKPFVPPVIPDTPSRSVQVSEPAPLTLFALGLLCLAMIRRKRQHIK